MEKEERDLLSVSLATQLSHGELNLTEVQKLLDDLDLKRWAQPEDVKTQLRGSLLAAQIFDENSGVCTALVAREFALRCVDRDIFYGLEFGSADAVAAADYVAALFLLRLSNFRDAIPRLAELARITADAGDHKGSAEAFAALATVAVSLDDYDHAANYFAHAIGAVTSALLEENFATTFSTQDMVRIDSKNIFNFDSDRIFPEFSTTASVLCFLDERLAFCLLQLQRLPEAIQFSSRALKAWRDDLRTSNPRLGITTLMTRALVLAAQGKLRAARKVAHELKSLEAELALPPDDRMSASLLAALG